MKLAATVILYNPPENYFDNIYTYIDEIEKLYIFDNSSERSVGIPDKILNKAEYFHSGTNEGIAKRLNEAIEKSISDGYDYLLTMDQDSSFQTGDINKYVKLIEEETDLDNISMFGIRYYPLDNKSIILKKYNQLLITSGSVINVVVANKLNGFDENLFIDGVDTEFCLKSFKNGFQTVSFNQLSLNHNLGERKSVRTPMLKKKFRSFHNPTRIYFIIRNYLYLRKIYPEFRSYLKNDFLLNEIKNSILYSGKAFKYIKPILQGIIHYKLNKLGKQNNDNRL